MLQADRIRSNIDAALRMSQEWPGLVRQQQAQLLQEHAAQLQQHLSRRGGRDIGHSRISVLRGTKQYDSSEVPQQCSQAAALM